MDLNSAFDTIDHTILIESLKCHVGIQRTAQLSLPLGLPLIFKIEPILLKLEAFHHQ